MNPILRINTLGQQVDRELLLKALRDEAVLSLPYLLVRRLAAPAAKKKLLNRMFKTRLKRVKWRAPNNKVYTLYIGRWHHTPGAFPFFGVAESGVILMPAKPLNRELELGILGHELRHLKQRTFIDSGKMVAGVTGNYLGRKLAQRLTRGSTPAIQKATSLTAGMLGRNVGHSLVGFLDELLADYSAGAVTRDKDALIKYLKQGKFWRNVRESLLQGTNLHPPFFMRKFTVKLAKHNPALRASIGRVLNTSRGLRRYLPW